MAQSASMPLLHEKSRDEAVAEWNGALSRSMGPDFHPFSDTDLSPPPRSVALEAYFKIVSFEFAHPRKLNIHPNTEMHCA